jgi:hypothetical protein
MKAQYSKNNIKPINSLGEHNAEILIAKTGGKYVVSGLWKVKRNLNITKVVSESQNNYVE